MMLKHCGIPVAHLKQTPEGTGSSSRPSTAARNALCYPELAAFVDAQGRAVAGIAVVVCCGVSIFCFIKRKAVARRAAEFEAAMRAQLDEASEEGARLRAQRPEQDWLLRYIRWPLKRSRGENRNCRPDCLDVARLGC